MRKECRKRPRIGDIMEIQVDGGYAYFHFAGKHPKYGAAIRVFPGIFKEQLQDFSSVGNATGYVTFYPLGSAVNQGLVRIVGATPINLGCGIPEKLRRAGAIDRHGTILTWFIVSGSTEEMRHELTVAEQDLSIISIWNHEMLVHKIERGWTPNQTVTSHRLK